VRPRYFRSASELRRWFHAHHADTGELWIGLYKKGSGRPGITYREAVDEALCFGWIDGVAKGVDDERYMQRFTPRKAKSYWSTARSTASHTRRCRATFSTRSVRTSRSVVRSAPTAFSSAVSSSLGVSTSSWSQR
jgi:hypothetical protein